ncbi:MAG: lamin tail domain-containing protein [Promethearchaeota archaeon]|nr:MAG: lamin tail domain-containing protein [Candidatus Lokiarchaeota archaeon]
MDFTSVHTWNEPSGSVTFDVDTTTYDNGIHNVTLIATPDGESPIQIDVAVNIVNTAEWKLLISEVRFDAVTEPNGEFFEIYNGFDFDLVLADWIITDNEDTYSFPDGTFIRDEEVLIFSRDETAFTTEMADIGITGVTVDVIYGDILLSNSGDELILKDSSSTEYDAVVWGSGSHPGVVAFSGSVDEDESIQRVPATQDTDDCSVDFIINTPTPGTVNITTSTPPTETTTPTETSTESSGLFPGFGLGITILGIVSLATFVTLLLKKRK